VKVFFLVLVPWLLAKAQQPAPTPKPAEPKPPSESAPANLLGRVNAQGGEARRNENIFITAIDNNAQKESGIRFGMTATAITEFHAASRFFGAEFGVSPSNPPHLAPSRPGKTLHGGLYWTHSNSLLSARSFFQVGSVLPARENHAGLRLLTPLNKSTFLSVEASDEFRSGYVNGNILVPLASERSCLSPDPAICAVINRFLAAWPNQVPNRPDIEARALNTNAPQRLDTTTASPRLEHIHGKHRFTARHSWTSQQVDAFQLVAGQNPDTTTRSHDARLTWTWTPSARTNLDFTSSFLRNTTLLVPEPNAVGPQVQIGTAFDKLGPGSSIPIDRVFNRFRQALRFQHRLDRHTLSAGFEFTRLQYNGAEVSSNRGNIYFRNDFGRDAITNFRLGIVNRYSFGLGGITRGFRRNEPSLFFQDNWRLHPSFDLSFGLRYQPQTSLNEVNSLTDIPFACDCNNLAPNFGFAWRLPRRTGVLRTSYSTQFGDIPPATLSQLRWNPPTFQKIENQAPPLLDLLRGISIDPNGRAIVFFYPRDLATPYSHQFTLNWQAPLAANRGRLELAYIGSRTWKLLYMQYANRAQRIPGIAVNTTTINDRRPDNRYFDFRVVDNLSRAYYDAGKLQYTLPTTRGWTLSGAYWFSKAIDTGASFLSIAAGDDASQGHSQTLDDVVGDLRAPSSFHQSHAATANLTYQISSRRRWLRSWRLSSVLVARSGTPFSVITGSDAPGYGNVDGVSGDRPVLLDPSILGRAITHPDSSRQMLPGSAFRYLTLDDKRGNLGSNVFRRAPLRNWNASLERRFTLIQDRSLAFRAESLNLSNTPQFAEPVADLSNPAFGKITNTLNDGRSFRFTISFDF
jgi:hypothetical protein